MGEEPWRTLGPLQKALQRFRAGSSRLDGKSAELLTQRVVSDKLQCSGLSLADRAYWRGRFEKPCGDGRASRCRSSYVKQLRQ